LCENTISPQQQTNERKLGSLLDHRPF